MPRSLACLGLTGVNCFFSDGTRPFSRSSTLCAAPEADCGGGCQIHVSFFMMLSHSQAYREFGLTTQEHRFFSFNLDTLKIVLTLAQFGGIQIEREKAVEYLASLG
ncbi:hypothetical protein B0H65DRAFT_446122 [Neurospora tetraspora]|uniref:Uncharacterized protein n=1 Tax=Neurospora tetraspora TaxID=94610 RepID=A0AAE0J802_9PEZI|nr:hypothetical protein B0H65DRAFT_446122 [Neurospora tetraspora]